MKERMKKDFQKAVKAYRDTLPMVNRYMGGGVERQERPDYPKAILTARQAENRTATVSWGYWCKDSQILMYHIDKLRKSKAFSDFCTAYGVTVGGIERSGDGWVMMRLNY